MSPRQIVFVTFIALGLLGLVLELIRRHMLREKYSLLWFFISVALLSVPWLYRVYAALGRLVGIIEPNSLFFFLAILGLVLLSLQFSLALSTAYYQRKQLIQQVGLLEERLRQVEAALQAKEGAGQGPPEIPEVRRGGQ